MRGPRLILGSVVLAIVAFSTGLAALTFLAWLLVLLLAGAWLLTRWSIRGLEAGYAVDRRAASVGETLTIAYTVRDPGRLPRLWLDVHSPTTLPSRLPGHAVSLRPRQQRSWTVQVPLLRRGHHRIEPAVIRTGDPLGLFEAYATVGSATSVVVTPRVEPLPLFRLPPALIQGTAARPERTPHTTPLVTGVRPYAPGDPYNRIHWRSSARHGELQVKEFDTQRTADVWLYLDLDRTAHTGQGDTATVETAVRVAASIGGQALAEGRSLAIAAAGSRRVVVPPDRGSRQLQRLLHLLAGATADASTPLVELLLATLPQLRRGMTAVVVTPSLDPAWVGPIAGLRARGVGALVCLVDPVAHDAQARAGRQDAADDADDLRARDIRALRHTLAEHDIPSFLLDPVHRLGEQLVNAPSAGREAA
ncbi:MAG: DUF58 domain-containing protein [Chloroflexota bacterium]